MEKLNLSFIEGIFDSSDGQELLSYLISKKITYHQNRLFDLDIKYSEDCQFSKMRIASLTDSRDQMNAMIREAAKLGKNIRVSSTINIELVEASEANTTMPSTTTRATTK